MREKVFSVAVIATMSSGKSTVLNAMLGVPLLPSKNEACTAIVTKIRDIDELLIIQGKVHSKNGEVSNWHNLTNKSEYLQEWNNYHNSKIEIQGNFSHIDNDRFSIEFWDTPGPNNSCDKDHAEISNDIIEGSDYSYILYVINATQFGVDDERALLQKLAEKSKNKSRRIKILFAVNKADQLDIENSELPLDLTVLIKRYLREIGFGRPNVIPVMSLLSLEIRQCLTALKEGVELPFSKRKQNGLIHDIRYVLEHKKEYLKGILNTKKKNYYFDRVKEQNRYIDYGKSIEIGGEMISVKKLVEADILTGIPFIEEILEDELIKKSKRRR